MTIDIFLSYARRDADERPHLGLLEERLKSAGYSVWRDDKLRAGEGYSLQLSEALDDSRVVLVLWGDAAVKSEWVYDEAARAKRAGKLIPISITAAAPPIGFGALQTIPFADWDGDISADCYAQLSTLLMERLGPTSTAKQTAEALRSIQEYALHELSMDYSEVTELTMDAPISALTELEDLDALREDVDFADLSDSDVALWSSICGIAYRERISPPQTERTEIQSIGDLARLLAPLL